MFDEVEVAHAREMLRAVIPKHRHIVLDEDTPARMMSALSEMLSGYRLDVDKLDLSLFPADGCDQIVAVNDMPFVSLCEHHVLPFFGTVSVAYLPGDMLIGLSKIPRIVRAVTRRLQMQERITKEIADAIGKAEPNGIIVHVEAQHMCMRARGIESTGKMTTAVCEGVFREGAAARAEAYSLMGRRV